MLPEDTQSETRFNRTQETRLTGAIWVPPRSQPASIQPQSKLCTRRKPVDLDKTSRTIHNPSLQGAKQHSMRGKILAVSFTAFCCVWGDCGSTGAVGQTAIVNAVVEDAVGAAPLRSRRHRRIQYRTVYFATNRQVDIDAIGRARSANAIPLPTDAVFLERLGPGMAYGWADVSYPTNRKRGDTGYNNDPKTQNPYRDFAVDDYEVLSSRQEFLAHIRAATASAPNSSLVHVHGFDVSFEEAAERTAQMSLDIDNNAVPIFFSWPSAHELTSYSVAGFFGLAKLYSKASDNSKQSRPYVGAFLSQIASLPWPYKLVAHSMGADVSGNALLTSHLYDRYALPKRDMSPPEAVLFVAPDIAENDFSDQLAPILSAGGSRVTVYCTDDWALWASQLYNGTTRLGWCEAEGQLVSGIDIVVVHGKMTDVLRHSYFLGSIRLLEDMTKVLTGPRPVNQTGVRHINLP